VDFAESIIVGGCDVTLLGVAEDAKVGIFTGAEVGWYFSHDARCLSIPITDRKTALDMRANLPVELSLKFFCLLL